MFIAPPYGLARSWAGHKCGYDQWAFRPFVVSLISFNVCARVIWFENGWHIEQTKVMAQNPVNFMENTCRNEIPRRKRSWNKSIRNGEIVFEMNCCSCEEKYFHRLIYGRVCWIDQEDSIAINSRTNEVDFKNVQNYAKQNWFALHRVCCVHACVNSTPFGHVNRKHVNSFGTCLSVSFGVC